ncbi:hypothetical protein JG687_00018065, partial [Phytophthora cactorum]
GVYVAHWFDYYISTYILSSDKSVSTDTEPLSKTELDTSSSAMCSSAMRSSGCKPTKTHKK